MIAFFKSRQGTWCKLAIASQGAEHVVDVAYLPFRTITPARTMLLHGPDGAVVDEYVLTDGVPLPDWRELGRVSFTSRAAAVAALEWAGRHGEQGWAGVEHMVDMVRAGPGQPRPGAMYVMGTSGTRALVKYVSGRDVHCSVSGQAVTLPLERFAGATVLGTEHVAGGQH